MVIDRLVLLAGADLVLGVAPQVVQRVELRRPLGQPDQFGPRPLGHAPGARCGVAGVLVQQQGDVPTPVMPVEVIEERLEVPGPLPLPDQEKLGPRPEVEAPEDHPAGVAAREEDLLRLTPQRPTGPEWGDEQEVGLVLGEKRRSGAAAAGGGGGSAVFFSNSGSGSRTYRDRFQT
jgi:hypothetical protein